MAQPRVLILRAPGTNCDVETAYAFERAGGRPERVHVNRLLEQPQLISDFQILCLPGGFSYGDDIAAGRILGSLLQHHLAAVLSEFKAAGKLILGICNGFQILMRTGLLLEPTAAGPSAVLCLNESGKFEDRWVQLRVEPGQSVFLAGLEQMYLPVAHAEGRFVIRDAATRQQLLDHGQLVLRYATDDASSSAAVPYPANPNGSQENVAGICDATGHVCGLMPHPERYIDRTQHPRWTREQLAAEGDGLALFRNAVRFWS
jgi:phosphoribosylformylglycinamidine synthase